MPMNRSFVFAALAALFVAGAGPSVSSAEAGPRISADFSFFVAQSADGSANLGGLAGADARCRALAGEVGAGGKTWRAYLSAARGSDGRVVQARDRIGVGPWFNAQGVRIARDLEDLHGDGHRIDRHTALDAQGSRPDRAPHDVLTGSGGDGRLAFVDGTPATCGDWTSAGEGVARIGHDDRMDADSHGNPRFRRFEGSWNSEHDTIGCSARLLEQTGGGGGFYCFAVEGAIVVRPTPPDTTPATFAHGLNVNHWLGDNIAAVDGGPAMSYGADWFGEADVAWIASQGYDHLRIQVAGNRWITSAGELDEAALAPFDQALDWTKRHGLGLVLAMHGLPGFRNGIRFGEPPTDVGSPFTDAATRADAAYLWWLVTRRYESVGPRLRFELLTSPGAASADEIRLYNTEVLAAVRRADAQRVVYLTSRDMRAANAADVVAGGDRKVALALRFFEPEVFTRQFDPKAPRVRFPGSVPEGLDAPAFPAGTNLTIEDLSNRVGALAEQARAAVGDREVYVGLFGALGDIEEESAATYLRTVRAAFERHGIGWAVYDYNTGGAVRCCDEPDRLRRSGGPTHIHRALFPMPKAR
jgi:hypothetical protein